MLTLLNNAIIINEGVSRRGSVVVKDDIIADIVFSDITAGAFDKVIDLTGAFLLPGVIDEHVHFREPGMTERGDIESESRAALKGGVTSFFDMPNTLPPTTTVEALDYKRMRAAAVSHVNYSFFLGVDSRFSASGGVMREARCHIPGVKVFMGATTGDTLVDSDETLEAIFRAAAALGLPVMTHCEDMTLIGAAARRYAALCGGDPPIALHSVIRGAEACYVSALRAVTLARRLGTRLHVAHVSTARELSLFTPSAADGPLPSVTAEVCLPHLLFDDGDYALLGSRIKCNPAVKSRHDRDALREALATGRVTTVATDHAPHLLRQKEGGAARAASGMPMIQFALPAMLELVDSGVITMERVAALMCHNPARLFRVRGRGFIRRGYKADITIVRRSEPWTVTRDIIESKCGWSPLEGHRFHWKVERTIVNGGMGAEEIMFDR